MCKDRQLFEVSTTVKNELLKRNIETLNTQKREHTKIEDELCNLFRDYPYPNIQREKAVNIIKHYFKEFDNV